MQFTDAVKSQRAFFLSGATRPPEFRRERLSRLARAIGAAEPRLFAALRADLRKSPHEAYASEVGFVQAEIQHALRHLGAWMKPRRRSTPPASWPSSGRILPEPYGVALIIGPWNYPFQLLLAPLVGAIAAGNCAVLKPSEFAPRTASEIARLIGEHFPPEHLAVFEGERETSEALLREKFDTIFFTGSTPVGRAVMSAAAVHLTPVTLELGGKCPCIVCGDVPLETVARRIAWGKFMNAGQTCVAPDFVLAAPDLKPHLLDVLGRVIKEFYGENPQQSPHYSRIVNRRHFDRLAGYLGSGRIVHGGQQDPGDLYIAPTVLADPPWEAPVMQEEIFGPILPVLGFESIDNVLLKLRDRPAPLALYLFSGDRDTQERVLAGTRSGGVALNDVMMHMVGANLPFGGLGESGMGAYHGRASFDSFTHYRSVLKRSLLVEPGLFFPPPKASLGMVKRTFRWLIGG